MGSEDGFFVDDSGTSKFSFVTLWLSSPDSRKQQGDEEICGEKLEFCGLITGYVVLRSHFVTWVVLDVLLFSANKKCPLLPPPPPRLSLQVHETSPYVSGQKL